MLNVITLHNIFHFFCLLVTIFLQAKCIYKYILDEDVSVVNYKRFHDEKDNIYPSFSFCVLNPFLEHELKKYGTGVNITSYSHFLMGKQWNEKMLQIDFDNVTVSLKSNLISIRTRLLDKTTYYTFDNVNGKQYIHDSIENKTIPALWKTDFYVSFRSAFRKCFTFDVPMLRNKLVFS